MTIKTAKQIYKKSEKKHALTRFEKLPTSATILTPVEWLEQNRYMPAEITDYYGQFDGKSVPHLIEPLNRIHPDDPCTHLAIMKSVQSAATVTLIEGATAYYTAYKLGSCLYITSTKSMGKVRSSSALDVLIDSSGLKDMLKPMSTRMKRKTADTTFYKEFMGGVKWLITSYNSIGDLKSNTFHLICPDEWDEAGVELADQGDIAGIIEGRTMAARQFKILFVSTPSRLETSRIHKQFIKGDQRRFFVPCPICNEAQILDLKGEGRDYGLTFGMKKDEHTGARILDPSSVRYICKHCKNEFTEADKHKILLAGEWRPTWKGSEFKPKSPHHRSYHVQGLISPFLSWERVCQKFIDTDFGQNIMMFKDFTINVMGKPWAHRAKRAKWNDLYDNRSDYLKGEIPEGGVIITGGADVHLNRIEVILTAWGRGSESWIIEKVVFFGDTREITGQVWAQLSAWSLSAEYKILGEACGIAKIAIDQGYNPTEKNNLGRGKDFGKKPHVVQEFVSGNPLFIAVRGVTGNAEIIREHRIQRSELKRRYDVAVDTLKESIFERIENTNGPGAIHFPHDFEKENFKQFCSEVFEERPNKKGWGWVKKYERNEVLDCYVYSEAAAYWLRIPAWTEHEWNEFVNSLTADQ